MLVVEGKELLSGPAAHPRACETRSIHETASEVKMTRVAQDDIPLSKTTTHQPGVFRLEATVFVSSSTDDAPWSTSRPALVMHPELAMMCVLNLRT